MPSARRPLAWVAASLAVLVWGATADAGFVTYSSSGELRQGNNPDNVWILPDSVTPVTWSMTVDTGAVDDSGLAERVWFFDAKIVSATFVINGVEAQALAPGFQPFLGFYDNTSGGNGVDAVAFAMGVKFNGVTVGVNGEFALADSTFSFTNSLESAPVFASTATTEGRSSGVLANSYSFVVTPGTTFTVTQSDTAAPNPAPAPPGLVLVLSGAATLGLGAVTRRLRWCRAVQPACV